jgi:hypothetical protein
MFGSFSQLQLQLLLNLVHHRSVVLRLVMDIQVHQQLKQLVLVVFK